MCDLALNNAEKTLDYVFKDRSFLTRALTHASSVGNREESNERLEFLGDAILGFYICEILFEMFPNLLEGELTKLKSTLVSRATCARVAREGEYGSWLKMGKGMAVQGAIPLSVLAGLYEALLGAIYLDGGHLAAKKFIERTIGPFIEEARRDSHQFDFKSILQKVVQRDEPIQMCYRLQSERGPDHDKEFESAVWLNGEVCPSGHGSTKKQAEQRAALEALIVLGKVIRNSEDGSLKIVSELE